jgi:predicted dithiol-disulfide oxidoreductase (DUF899 family)
MCSIWVDGFQGVARHLTQHAALAVIGKAPLPKLRAWARLRGWDRLRILSSHGTSFNPDLRVDGPDGSQLPATSVFVRDGDEVRHFYTRHAEFADGRERGMDLLSPVWNVPDLLPGGRGSGYAQNEYAARA